MSEHFESFVILSRVASSGVCVCVCGPRVPNTGDKTSKLSVTEPIVTPVSVVAWNFCREAALSKSDRQCRVKSLMTAGVRVCVCACARAKSCKWAGCRHADRLCMAG